MLNVLNDWSTLDWFSTNGYYSLVLFSMIVVILKLDRNVCDSHHSLLTVLFVDELRLSFFHKEKLIRNELQYKYSFQGFAVSYNLKSSVLVSSKKICA